LTIGVNGGPYQLSGAGMAEMLRIILNIVDITLRRYAKTKAKKERPYPRGIGRPSSMRMPGQRPSAMIFQRY
jgi:hypothetical protein